MRTTILKLVLPLVAGILTAPAAVLAASVWHVATTGNDITGTGSSLLPFATIQRGIDESANGDTVLVADGTYHERVSFYSKSIVVGSWILRDGDSLHIENTIINGDPVGLPVSDTLNVVRITSSGLNESTLRGFTVTNGEGYGLLCYASILRVANCVLVDSGIVIESTGNNPDAEVHLRSTRILGSGVRIPNSGSAYIAHCEIEGTLLGAGTNMQFPFFDVDSSIIGGAGLNENGSVVARACTFTGDLAGFLSIGFQLVNCIVQGRVAAGIEGYFSADSCSVAGIHLSSETTVNAKRSVISRPITASQFSIGPYLSLQHCTVLDSIVSSLGSTYIVLDSCNLVLPAPIDFYNLSPYSRISMRAHCCNFYADGFSPFKDVDSAVAVGSLFDTVNVFSLPPQFCNPGLGDYTIFDTSPCAPANSPCGVLVGAKPVGCLNEHVWHVSTSGDDTLGNGTAAAPFATIQKGIDRAEDGDTVLVQDGTYHERISFLGKPIVVGSWLLRDADTAHIGNTIIDGDTLLAPLANDSGCVVRFVNSEDSNSVLSGMTIIGASGSQWIGAGVLCYGSSPRVIDCVFSENFGVNVSAVVSQVIFQEKPQFLRCTIAGNSNGVRIRAAEATFVDCKLDSAQNIILHESSVANASGSTFRFVRVSSFLTNNPDLYISDSKLFNCVVDFLVDTHLANDSLFDSEIRAADQGTANITDCVFTRSHLFINDAHCNVRRSRMENGVTVQAQNLQRILIEDSFIGDTLRIFGGNNSKINVTGSTLIGNGISIESNNGFGTEIRIERCIVLTSGEPALYCFSTNQPNNLATLFTRCNDFDGYAGQEWLSGNITIIDTANTFRVDPKFCNEAGGDYTISDTSPCAPANNSCGVQIGALGIGCLDVSPNIWTFGNSQANMWPESWWQQFNYCFGISPCQQLCLACSPSTFPDWDLFASAIGEDQAYLDPPPGSVNYRPSAVAQWEALRGEWTGSCFGFAATSFLFFDNYFDVETVFPGNSSLSTVPLNAASRALVNKYYLYQFGYAQQQKINSALGTTTPSQTLAECQTMFSRIPRNDQVLMMFNQTGSGGHAVAPYRTIQDGTNPNLWHLYVHDSNIPNDTTQRVMINLEADTWSYTGQPSWGGTTGLFLLDTVSTYLAPLVLADTTDQSEKIRFYFGAADSVLIEAAADSIGFNEQDPFGDITGVTPIIPADGMGTMPIGYFLPSGEWYFRASGVIDGVFTVVDGEKRIFRNGGAKSGIISCYFKANATLASLTAYGWTEVESPRDIYDSSFIEVISVQPDSEIVITVSGLGLVQGDSVTISLAENQSVQVDNFGDETSYDLEIQIVTPALDTAFYTENVTIGESTSHLITPDWRSNDDSLLIAIDTTMTGAFDSTITVPNQNTPQFICGDADGNSIVTISDAVFLINYIFAGGPAPAPLVRGDADCNSIVTISDAVYLINYIFAGGAPPCAACP